MNQLKLKLRSRTGASITFALLLFLVCAVLSSVIIVAATTSAGRMAGIAEMDQRYYSVTSASTLLKELLNNQTVSVVKVTKSWSSTTYTDGVAGTPVPNNDGTTAEKPQEVAEYLVAGQNAAQILAAVAAVGTTELPSNWEQITINSTIQKASIPNDAAYQYYYKKTTTPRTLTLESPSIKTDLGLGESDTDPVAVTIEETLNNAGTITLTVGNANGAQFKQELVFSANVVNRTDTKSVDDAPTNYSSTDTTTGEGESAVTTTKNSYTVTTATTTIEITTLTWTLDSIKTLSGGPAS